MAKPTRPGKIGHGIPWIVKAASTEEDLTRIRLQRAIHFCLHRGSLPENTPGRQPRFAAKPEPKNFRKKLYVRWNHRRLQARVGQQLNFRLASSLLPTGLYPGR